MGATGIMPARQRDGRRAAWPVGAAFFACVLAAPAAADDIVIDSLAFKSLDGDAFAIAHVEFLNTNLTREEVVKLLTPDSPSDDDRALALKLKAGRISIPSIDILGTDGSKIHIAGLTAVHVEAGRIESLDLAGIDAGGADKGGPITVKAGALHVDGLDLAQWFAADDDAAVARPTRLGGLTLGGLDFVGPDPGDAPGQSLHIAIGSIALHNDYSGDTLKHGRRQGRRRRHRAVARLGSRQEPRQPRLFQDRTGGRAHRRLPRRRQDPSARQPDRRRRRDGSHRRSRPVSATLRLPCSAPTAASRMQALLTAGVASLEVKVVNGGLFEKSLAYYAKAQGLPIDKLRAQWSAMVGQMAPAMLGGSPAGLTLAVETQKFIAEPKTLTIAVKAKSGALKAGDFMAIGDPSEIAGKLDISAAANR